MAAGAFLPADADEDVHGALERRLIEIVGEDIGGRLRAGRSRNDQVATDLRLLLLDALGGSAPICVDLCDALLDPGAAAPCAIPRPASPTCSTPSR